jgi:amino acid adenylation domain-containing protein
MADLDRRANAVIDMENGPIFHAALFKMTDAEHVFFFMPHHAVFDGWSFDVFLEELSVTYGSLTRGTTPTLADLPIQYGDFAAWQSDWIKSDRLKEQAAFWRRQLQDAPAALELPTDKPRPAVLSHVGATAFHNVPRALVDRLTTIGHEVGATFQMVLLAAFKTLLHRYSGQDDILVGTPIRGRTRPETEKLLGFFVNTLVLRSRVDANASFVDFLAQVRTTCLDAYSHDDMPFEILINDLKVARDPSRTPVFQAFFTFQDVRNRDSQFGDLSYRQVNVHPAASPTDLSFWAKETDGDLVCGIDYATDLFERATIDRFFSCLVTMLEGIAAAPNTSLARLPILAPAEARLLSTFNDNRAVYPTDRTIHGMIEEQVKKTPQGTAIIFDDRRLTYAEMNQRANRMARQLRAVGVSKGQIVGLCLERTDTLLVAMLAIFKAGGAYLPLDPSYPKDRLAFMVSDSAMRFMVTTAQASDGLDTAGLTLVDLEKDKGAIYAHLGDPLPPSAEDATPDTLAYIIYTSGSTGKPKGTLVPHRTAVNLLYSMRERPGMTDHDVLLSASTFSFDITIPDFFLTLTTGATMVIAPRDAGLDGALVVDLMQRHKINVAQATPSTWRMLIDAGWRGDPGLRLIAAGEALPKDLADTLGTMSKCVWNGYGPTETTVYTTFFAVPPGHKGPMYIGRPVHNVQVYILDKLMQPAPIGVPGEIFIGGAGVTDGYLNRPELTAERFVPDPFSKSGGRLYRSGDLGRYAADGNIEYWGRNDHQVKVRGFRIELGEIENALSTHPALKQVVVNVHEEKKGDVRLVAYFVPMPSTHVATTELRKHLRHGLPDYMIPQLYVEMEAMPISPNGKVDRRRLPKPASYQDEGGGGDGYVAPRSDEERVLADIWQGLLGMEKVSVQANFFDLGGHSLLSMQMLTQVEQKLGVKLSPLLVVLNTLEQIATEVSLQRQSPAQAATKSRGLAAKLFGKLTGGSK